MSSQDGPILSDVFMNVLPNVHDGCIKLLRHAPKSNLETEVTEWQ